MRGERSKIFSEETFRVLAFKKANVCHVISHAKMKNIPDGQRPDYTEWEAPETGALPIGKPAASRRSSAQRLPHSMQVLSNTFVLFYSSLITGHFFLSNYISGSKLLP